MTWNYQQICRNIAETKRLLAMTSFQRSNEYAAHHKADAWLAYHPLTKRQLSDYDDETLTLDVGVFGQFVVLKRPTEQRAIQAALHPSREYIIERREPRPRRWCIECQERHSPRAFVRSPKYLHGLSYACKNSLTTLRRRPWHHLQNA